MVNIREKIRRIPLARKAYRGLAKCAVQSGIIGLRQALTGRRDLILTFHRLRPANQPPDPFDTCPSMPVDVFRHTLAHVKERLAIVPLKQLWEKVEEKAAAVAITFDDGWRDTYELAFPVLQEFNAPATVFVTTGKIGSGQLFWQQALGQMCRDALAHPDRSSSRRLLAVPGLPRRRALTPAVYRAAVLAWKRIGDTERERLLHQAGWPPPSDVGRCRQFLGVEEIRAMAAAGIDFGSHTVNHPILPFLPREGIEKELTESKRTLEHLLGRTIDVISYPNGQYSDEVIACARAAGYRIGCTTDFRRFSRQDDPLRLPRTELSCDDIDGMEEFRRFGFQWQTR